MVRISIQKQVGARLRAIRVEKKLTQEALEEKGISSRYYSRIERGTANPTLGTLEGICKKMGVQMEDLFQFPSSKRNRSENELAAITRINNIMRQGDEESVRKLRVFLEEIL